MLCRCARALHATLVELDHLLARRSFDEALDLATRALARRLPETDINARFRVGRAHALWMGGRVGPARDEARRALRESTEPLTRARAADALALFAWKDAEFADAQALADAARRVYEERSMRAGLARSLQAEAGLLADRGQLEPALCAQTRRIEALGRSAPERLAEARADRSTLLTLLGRWDAAATDLEAAAELFRRQATPAVLALKRAALELSRGRADASRRLVEQARESERIRPSSPRVLAEACLVGSDVALAGGSRRTRRAKPWPRSDPLRCSETAEGSAGAAYEGRSPCWRSAGSRKRPGNRSAPYARPPRRARGSRRSPS